MRIAKQDCYGTDNVGVRRFIRAGDPVPEVFMVAAGDVTEVAGSAEEIVAPPEDRRAETTTKGAKS